MKGIEGPTRLAYRVIFGDTDLGGIVYHANYLRWFEAARCQLLRERGVAYTALLGLGLQFPVVESRCRHHLPARFEDELVIEARSDELKAASVRFSYRVLRGAEVLAEGTTLHACTDASGRARRIPAAVARALAAGQSA